MASKLYNRARVTISSTGTGTLSLSTAVSGYQTFPSAGAQNGDVVSYVIEDGLSWEVGAGTFNSVANTLSRTVTQSYNGSTYGTSPISVTTAAQVFISPLAADIVVNGGALGTPSSGTLTNCTGLPSTGVIGLAASATTDTTNASNISSGTLVVARGGSGATATTGTGDNVLSTSPTLVTPLLGTPTSGTLTNCTGLPIVAGTTGTLTAARGGTGLTALGTGVATALGNATNGASGFVALDANQNASIPGTLAMGSSFLRNRLINGSFSVDQRNAGAATVVTDAAYGPDRWKMLGEDSLGKLTARDTTIGGGRFNGVVTCVTSNNKYGVAQYIEGVNCKDLRGKTVTLSVVLSVSNARLGNIKMGIVEWTGTEDSMTSDMVSVWGADGTTPTLATNYSFKNTPANLSVTTTPATYSVSATLGTSFNNLAVFIWNDDKSFNANDAFYPTDVQLEEGSIATPFERRNYGQELLLCQRYFSKSYSQGVVPGTNVGGGNGGVYVTFSANYFISNFNFPTTMRNAPTVTIYDNIGGINKFSYFNASWVNGATMNGYGALNDSSGFIQTITQPSPNNLSFDFTASAEL